MWVQVLFVFEMKILLIFFKILRQNHNVTFVHQASSVPTYGCVQVSSPSPSPPNLKVLFYNGLLMRRLSRLWVFVDKATSYFDQKWNRSVKPLSISFPQVFIKKMRGRPQHFFFDKNKILVGRFLEEEKNKSYWFQTKVHFRFAFFGWRALTRSTWDKRVCQPWSGSNAECFENIVIYIIEVVKMAECLCFHPKRRPLACPP